MQVRAHTKPCHNNTFKMRLFFITTVLYFFCLVPHCQCLTAIRSRARLPMKRAFTTSIYDGEDSIYTFGGSEYRNPSFYDYKDILKYTISTDTIQIVNQLPLPLFYSSTSMDMSGNIFLFGGIERNAEGGLSYSPLIFKYFPKTNILQQISTRLPYRMYDMAAAKTSNNQVYLFGGSTQFNTFLFDMDSLSLTSGGRLPTRWEELKTTAVSDNLGNSFIFGHLDFAPAPVIKLNLQTLQMVMGQETLPYFRDRPASVWDGTNAYVIGGHFPVGNAIIQFNPVTMTHVLIPVTNFPGDGDSILSSTAAVYVEKLKRIYFMGGVSISLVGGASVYHDEIWYIDLELQ